MKRENPWDSGWRNALMWSIVAVPIVAFIAFRVWAKVQLCDAYYPEVSRIVCLSSDSTLPQRNNR